MTDKDVRNRETLWANQAKIIRKLEALSTDVQRLFEMRRKFNLYRKRNAPHRLRREHTPALAIGVRRGIGLDRHWRRNPHLDQESSDSEDDSLMPQEWDLTDSEEDDEVFEHNVIIHRRQRHPVPLRWRNRPSFQNPPPPAAMNRRAPPMSSTPISLPDSPASPPVSSHLTFCSSGVSARPAPFPRTTKTPKRDLGIAKRDPPAPSMSRPMISLTQTFSESSHEYREGINSPPPLPHGLLRPESASASAFSCDPTSLPRALPEAIHPLPSNRAPPPPQTTSTESIPTQIQSLSPMEAVMQVHSISTNRDSVSDPSLHQICNLTQLLGPTSPSKPVSPMEAAKIPASNTKQKRETKNKEEPKFCIYFLPLLFDLILSHNTSDMLRASSSGRVLTVVSKRMEHHSKLNLLRSLQLNYFLVESKLVQKLPVLVIGYASESLDCCRRLMEFLDEASRTVFYVIQTCEELDAGNVQMLVVNSIDKAELVEHSQAVRRNVSQGCDPGLVGQVCKRWSSVSVSPTSQSLGSQIPYRDPWFLMVEHELSQSIILIPAKRISFPPPISTKSSKLSLHPVMAWSTSATPWWALRMFSSDKNRWDEEETCFQISECIDEQFAVNATNSYATIENANDGSILRESLKQQTFMRVMIELAKRKVFDPGGLIIISPNDEPRRSRALLTQGENDAEHFSDILP